MKYYIGIDIGTSSVKVTCIDENANVTGESSKEYKIEEPRSGWKEIDPEKWIKGIEDRSDLHLCGMIQEQQI